MPPAELSPSGTSGATVPMPPAPAAKLIEPLFVVICVPAAAPVMLPREASETVAPPVMFMAATANSIEAGAVPVVWIVPFVPVMSPLMATFPVWLASVILPPLRSTVLPPVTVKSVPVDWNVPDARVTSAPISTAPVDMTLTIFPALIAPVVVNDVLLSTWN